MIVAGDKPRAGYVSLQTNPDTEDLKLRGSLVALACQEGVYYECQ